MLPIHLWEHESLKGYAGHLRVADKREVEEDDIVLSHGKVMLHGGLLQGDPNILLNHAAAAYCEVVQLRLAQTVAKAIQRACMQQQLSLSTAWAIHFDSSRGKSRTLPFCATLPAAQQCSIALLFLDQSIQHASDGLNPFEIMLPGQTFIACASSSCSPDLQDAHTGT